MVAEAEAMQVVMTDRVVEGVINVRQKAVQ